MFYFVYYVRIYIYIYILIYIIKSISAYILYPIDFVRSLDNFNFFFNIIPYIKISIYTL